MLILTRKMGESIRIGDDISITVLPQKNTGQVKLGIDAPANVHVYRQELYNKIIEQHDVNAINQLPHDIRKRGDSK